jgi:uncharacterized protein YdeI (YjbR/CyaY-like superfamily)
VATGAGKAIELPELSVVDGVAWRSWLAEHHTERNGVWLMLAKKGTTEPTSLTYAEALDEALCFGWIDGQVRGGGGGPTYYQRFTPRRSRSMWSKRNIGHIARLIDEGRLTAAGQAEVDRAKADGRWDAAYRQADNDVPADLAAAIAENPRAAAMFEILTSQNRFALCLRVQNVKRAETRARKIAEYVEMLARGETIHPQKRTLG